MPINIKGKQYVMVNERVEVAHTENDKLSITTEIVLHDPVLCKATVTTNKGVFTGYSAANPDKSIEKMSPYEVAETSAVGRALGFAGYGIADSIATADEINKGGYNQTKTSGLSEPVSDLTMPCKLHNEDMREYKSPTTGNIKFCHMHNGALCFGK